MYVHMCIYAYMYICALGTEWEYWNISKQPTTSQIPSLQVILLTIYYYRGLVTRLATSAPPVNGSWPAVYGYYHLFTSSR